MQHKYMGQMRLLLTFALLIALIASLVSAVHRRHHHHHKHIMAPPTHRRRSHNSGKMNIVPPQAQLLRLRHRHFRHDLHLPHDHHLIT
ncbi:hypothetical protein GCK32_015078 [Trichostrongylus colubriformis]|uniref:Uncharacterized protein n=1 Tax=Trichostrongylus colubriformis TaxID=6319 RepID=A0AAN8F1J1_TRICO